MTNGEKLRRSSEGALDELPAEEEGARPIERHVVGAESGLRAGRRCGKGGGRVQRGDGRERELV